jgi:hypothetical protein
MNNEEITFLIFVVSLGIGIVTGYLLKYMPNKDDKDKWG